MCVHAHRSCGVVKSDQLMPKKKETLQLPPIRVVYCVSKAQQETGCQIIQSKIAHAQSKCVWGFDCEWKVSYVSGQGTHKVALIQFGAQDVILLFQISQSGLHSTLVDIIKSADHIKVGVNILGDVQKLERDFPSFFPARSICGAVDVRRLSEVTAVPPQPSLAGTLFVPPPCITHIIYIHII
jgi:hypothetical protein